MISTKALAGSGSSSSTYSSSPSNGNDGRSEKPRPHVLAVDDSQLDRVLVANLLRKSSCKVTIVENAMKALEYLGLLDDQQQGSNSSSSSNGGHHHIVDNKVNLILSDYCMPEMTGFDLLKKIKESSRMREVPVVIMSSESVPAIINQCLEEGAHMFIKKPLKLSDVQMMMLRCQVTKL